MAAEHALKNVPLNATVCAEGYVVEHGGYLWLDKIPMIPDEVGPGHVTASSPKIFGDVPRDEYLSIRGIWRGDGIEVRAVTSAADIRRVNLGAHMKDFSWADYRALESSLPAPLDREVSAVGVVTDRDGLPCYAVYTMPLLTQEWAVWSSGKPVVLDPILTVEC